MGGNELLALGEDIKKQGLRHPLILLRDDNGLSLLDGRNRLDAMEAVGIKFSLDVGESAHSFSALKTEGIPVTRNRPYSVLFHQLQREQGV